MPEDQPVPKHHRVTLRAWLAVLPWHLIYALGTLIFVLLVAVLSSVIE
jgi:hypothetical protein